MSIEIIVGRLGKQTISQIADKASHEIVGAGKTRALCVTPDGVATLESVGHVLDEDLVGVYSVGPGKFQLWRMIQEDLHVAVAERGLGPRAKARKRVYAGRKSKVAA
ncbi:hypothetical protein [Lysobacter enzymogenes]|uniref:hypothetical protein n=1 Tax=Lysobacter enzymogenes TaxID=69 RepID=UPI001A95E565|nr:hypothetical protein [Lysobacter enzymogenes]QQP96470.1 hypothetical protein JHW38_25290 [Lysobacter enzymogenes]QQP96504.1 hypothetical protein JHW38_00140 [Lysobacter enzymogenes]